MRSTAMVAAGICFGIGIGIAGTLFFARPKESLLDRAEVAALKVRHPTHDLAAGLDLAWRRHIMTHAAEIRFRSVLESAISEPDVRTTAWFNSIDIADDRLDSLEEILRVKPVPETSLIGVWLTTGSDSDRRTIANAVARAYVEEVERDIRIEDRTRADHLQLAMNILRRRADDKAVELKTTKSESKRDEIRADLTHLGERRRRLEDQLDQQNLRTQSPNRSPVHISRFALPPDS